MIFNMVGSGGGGAEAKLDIISGIIKPTNPIEGTVWIETDIPITSYSFCATEPNDCAEGMIWLIIVNSGAAKITTPVDGDFIIIYPRYAKQYINGLWVEKNVKIYRDGVWVDGALQLLNYGDYSEAVTGGYSFLTSSTNATGAIEDNGLRLWVTNSQYVIARTNKEIDFYGTNTLKLYFDSLVAAYGTLTVDFMVASNAITSATEEIKIFSKTTVTGKDSPQATMVLDVSDIDSGYVYVKLSSTGNYTNATLYVREIRGDA